MSEWRDVDDRQSGVDEFVLFWRGGWDQPRVGYRGVHQQYYLLGESKPFGNGEEPTHWHPLPETPQSMPELPLGIKPDPDDELPWSYGDDGG